MRIDIMHYLKMWHDAPYPLSELNYEDVPRSRKELAWEMQPEDINELINFCLTTLSQVNDDGDLHFQFMEFMQEFIKIYKEKVAPEIVKNLGSEGPGDILRMLAYTKEPKYLDIIIKTINYDLLSKDDKHGLVYAISRLGGNNDYANRLIQIESNLDILEDLKTLLYVE